MLMHWPQERLDELYKRMKADFPANERPPKVTLKKQILSGHLKAYSLKTQAGEPAAYALCAGTGEVLITHLAVHEKDRGKGIGSAWLKKLAAFHEKEHSLLIVEVELPQHAANSDDAALRKRRIAFYERAGYTGYPTVYYKIFGVRLMLMVKPLGSAALPFNGELASMVRNAYQTLLPPSLMGQVFFE